MACPPFQQPDEQALGGLRVTSALNKRVENIAFLINVTSTRPSTGSATTSDRRCPRGKAARSGPRSRGSTGRSPTQACRSFANTSPVAVFDSCVAAVGRWHGPQAASPTWASGQRRLASGRASGRGATISCGGVAQSRGHSEDRRRARAAETSSQFQPHRHSMARIFCTFSRPQRWCASNVESRLSAAGKGSGCPLPRVEFRSRWQPRGQLQRR